MDLYACQETELFGFSYSRLLIGESEEISVSKIYFWFVF